MKALLFLATLFWSSLAFAVSGVNPFGVNVRSAGPSTVFLTFQNLDAGQTAAEAFWCGELRPEVANTNPTLQAPFAVQNANPCQPGTIFGRLPVRLDRSRVSTSGTFRNLTDIMSIPASVARRAYQDAIAGKNSSFFYVRRFSGAAGGDQYVIVTCRMGGGGARAPLGLIDVRLNFDDGAQRGSVLGVVRDSTLPRFSADVYYNGTGTLRGRWELVMPGDVEPTTEDLLTEASLPVERRALQRRYTLIERFSLFLPPTGQITIPGPDPEKLRTSVDGPYKVLLRIEASNEKEANSNTGGGRTVFAGGVAGFPMPVLRYYVGTHEDVNRIAEAAIGSVQQFLPPDGATAKADAPLSFQWVDVANGALYKLEVASADEVLLQAWVKQGDGSYLAPPWLRAEHADEPLRWRVTAVDASGRELARSDWRSLTLAAAGS
ncbi:MAG: hypothetical protein R3E83_01795 [Burkholderiaceae bacterium]